MAQTITTVKGMYERVDADTMVTAFKLMYERANPGITTFKVMYELVPSSSGSLRHINMYANMHNLTGGIHG